MGFPSIYFDGYYRVLSHTPSPINDLPLFGDNFATAAPFQLQDIDLSWESHRILNQKKYQQLCGTCNSNWNGNFV